MRIEATEARKRRWDHLKEATGEGTKSGALDVAADYYLRMRGGTSAIPNGQLEELMQRAVAKGSLTPEEIADALDCDELPVDAEARWSIGRDG